MDINIASFHHEAQPICTVKGDTSKIHAKQTRTRMLDVQSCKLHKHAF